MESTIQWPHITWPRNKSYFQYTFTSGVKMVLRDLIFKTQIHINYQTGSKNRCSAIPSILHDKWANSEMALKFIQKGIIKKTNNSSQFQISRFIRLLIYCQNGKICFKCDHICKARERKYDVYFHFHYGRIWCQHQLLVLLMDK